MGENREELGGSQYLNIIHKMAKGNSPQLNLEKEKSIHGAVMKLIKEGLLSSAHDCSEGGLAVTLAESCILAKLGAVITISENIRKDALLFGETQSRIIISAPPENRKRVESICKEFNLKCSLIGEVKGSFLKIDELINLSIADLEKAYRQAIPKIIES